MKIITVDQNTPEWLQARIGRPTASAFDKILTPSTLKPSAQRSAYLYRLVAEWWLGTPLDNQVTAWMQRGTAEQQAAADWYGFTHAATLRTVGFCLTDDESCGCSPDYLVGDDGLLEVKVPAAHTHVGYLLEGFGHEYRGQCQGQLYVTGRDWVDLVAYNPGMRNDALDGAGQVVERITPDHDWRAAFVKQLESFTADLADARVRMERLCGPPRATRTREQAIADLQARRAAMGDNEMMAGEGFPFATRSA